MQFKYPELLYALILLLIPILIHLFQLRKFKKVAFTNVAFLKKVTMQTRKSNTLKKWLVLLTRLSIFAMLILAFAQPYSTAGEQSTKPKETVIYVDNSFSMQAKGPSGQLLRQAIQDVIINIPEDQNFTLFTNNEVYSDISVKSSRNDLLDIEYTSNQLLPEAISLKAKKEFSNKQDTEKRLILISDFQQITDTPFKAIEGVNSYLVPLQPVVANNILIDTVFIANRKAETLSLEVGLSSLQTQKTNVPVSLYNGEELVAKATASLDKETTTSINFDIPSKTTFEGRLSIEDPLLKFDNSLYFSINTTQSIKVLAIGDQSTDYLKRVYRQPEFRLTTVAFSDLDYSSLNDYDLIVANEIANPPLSLASALSEFQKDGKAVLVIPNLAREPAQNIPFVNRLGGIQIGELTDFKKLLTTINYQHPLLRDVFEDQVQNFQYPSVRNSFSQLSGDPILSLEDGSAFLSVQDRVYVFASSLNTETTNFMNSPLVVPILYNIGAQSKIIPDLYYTIGNENNYDISIALQDDTVLQLNPSNNKDEVQIPLQQSYGNKVSINTTEFPDNQGIYDVRLKDSILTQVSYNHSRVESQLRYQKLSESPTLLIQNSITQLFDEFKQADTVNSLWKWFIIFALLFLVAELLILKFLK